jgi:hypothetical protein
MEAIVKAAEDQGYILEDNLIEEIGFDQVNNSLVDYNFLYRRPTTRFAYDIDSSDETILTAMNQPTVRATKRLLSKVSPSKK